MAILQSHSTRTQSSPDTPTMCADCSNTARQADPSTPTLSPHRTTNHARSPRKRTHRGQRRLSLVSPYVTTPRAEPYIHSPPTAQMPAPSHLISTAHPDSHLTHSRYVVVLLVSYVICTYVFVYTMNLPMSACPNVRTSDSKSANPPVRPHSAVRLSPHSPPPPPRYLCKHSGHG